MPYRQLRASTAQKPGIDHAEKACAEKSMVTDGWVSLDTADTVLMISPRPQYELASRWSHVERESLWLAA